VPAAIEFQREWQWDDVRARCHALVERFVEESGLPAAADDFGQMLAVELPPCDPQDVQRRLYDRHGIEVPCFERAGRPLLRLSVQGYNDETDVERLLDALPAVLPASGFPRPSKPRR
jgi:isopenicillin-N epimerase